MGTKFDKLLSVIKEKKLFKDFGITEADIDNLQNGKSPEFSLALKILRCAVENVRQLPEELKGFAKRGEPVLQELEQLPQEAHALIANSGLFNKLFGLVNQSNVKDALLSSAEEARGLQKAMKQGTLSPEDAVAFLGDTLNRLKEKAPAAGRAMEETIAQIVAEGPVQRSGQNRGKPN